MNSERHSFSHDDSVTLLEEEEGTFFQNMPPETTMEQTPLLGAEQDEVVGQKTPPHRKYDDSDDGDPVSANTSETSHVLSFEKKELISVYSLLSTTQLLEVIDRIEDEVDHTYDELVPLDVKLALEDKVFGWSHLSSDILGHIFFTLGAYTLAFLFITHVVGRADRLPMAVFRILRFVLSFWAGISAFRMVRRRRRVWLRSAYGSKDYEKDALRRRESVRESDRTTLLGRVRRRRNLMVERGHQRKLQKAVERFNKKRRKEEVAQSSPKSVRLLSGAEKKKSLRRLGSAPSIAARVHRVSSIPAIPRTATYHALTTQHTKSIGHDQILFAYGPIRNMPYSHGSFFGAAPFMLANPHWIDVLRLLMPDVYIAISLRVVHAPAPKLIHWAENNPVVAAYGTAHELENTNVMPNLEWDVFLDPHLVHRVEVVLDKQENFLRSCAPSDAYRGLSGKQLRDQILESVDTLGLTASQRSILVYYEAELRRRIETLVDNMLIAHGNLTQLILEQTGWFKKYNFSRVKRTCRTLGGGMFARQWLAVFAESLKLGKCLDGSSGIQEKVVSRKGDVLLYSTSCVLTRTGSSSDEDELDSSFRCQCLQCVRSSDECAENADLALPSLQNEQAELPCRNRRSADAPELRSSVSFSEGSLTSGADAERSPTRSLGASPLRSRPAPPDVVSSSKCLSTSIAESISIIKFITGCEEPLGLVFDIKSRCTPKRVWGLIIDFLRDAGARVEGVASFAVDDIRDISNHASKPVKELFFFHSAGDMQLACHDGRLKQGDTILFNAGSLLWDSRSSDAETLSWQALRRCWADFDADEVKRSYAILPFARAEESRASTIKSYKDKFGLSIGLYCQEFAIDEAALNIIVKHVNDYPDIYDLGLSWGGVNGVTVRGIQPGRFTLTDGFWNQRYASTPWDYNRFPEEAIAGMMS